MNAVWKYPLLIQRNQTVTIPRNSHLLVAQLQHGVVCLWVRVDRERTETETINILMVGTGHDIPEDFLSHLGTVQLEEGTLVLHIFEVVE